MEAWGEQVGAGPCYPHLLPAGGHRCSLNTFSRTKSRGKRATQKSMDSIVRLSGVCPGRWVYIVFQVKYGMVLLSKP